MTNPVIQTDIADILSRLNQRFDKLDERFNKIDERFDKIDERLNKLEVGQAEIKGEIRTRDEKLSGQIKTLRNGVSTTS